MSIVVDLLGNKHKDKAFFVYQELKSKDISTFAQLVKDINKVQERFDAQEKKVGNVRIEKFFTRILVFSHYKSAENYYQFNNMGADLEFLFDEVLEKIDEAKDMTYNQELNFDNSPYDQDINEIG